MSILIGTVMGIGGDGLAAIAGMAVFSLTPMPALIIGVVSSCTSALLGALWGNAASD